MEERYGVIEGFCEGYTKSELLELIVQSKEQGIGMDDLFQDGAIAEKIIEDLLSVLPG